MNGIAKKNLDIHGFPTQYPTKPLGEIGAIV